MYIHVRGVQNSARIAPSKSCVSNSLAPLYGCREKLGALDTDGRQTARMACYALMVGPTHHFGLAAVGHRKVRRYHEEVVSCPTCTVGKGKHGAWPHLLRRER